jgi:hypothetical protein
MKSELVTPEIFVEKIKVWFPHLNFENKEFIDSLYHKFLDSKIKTLHKHKCKFFQHRSLVSKHFYLERGWDEDVAKAKVTKQQHERSSYKFLAEKGVDIEKKSNSRKDAYKRSSDRMKSLGVYDEVCKTKGNSNRWEFYLDKINPNTRVFYTETEAREKIHNKQRKFLDKMWKMKREDPTLYVNDTSIEYYLNKGLTLEDAAIALKERQATFSLKKCIEKYGEKIGPIKWKDRQEKWQKTLDSKSPEEKMQILQKKMQNYKRYSEVSVLLFQKVIERFRSEDVELKSYFGDQEHFIWDHENQKIKFYDLYLPDLKLLVEYHGSVFHPHYSLTDEELQSWRCPVSKMSGIDRRAADDIKVELAKKNDLEILVLWEGESNLEQKLYLHIKNKLKI